MTVNTDTSTAAYTGNGSTAIFSVPFYFLADADLKVSKLTVAGVSSVLVLNSDYTVTGAGVEAGGSITTIPTLPSGDKIFIERNVDAVQQTEYPVNSAFPAASHERALDRLTMLAQQVIAKLTFGLFRDPLAATYNAGGNTISNVANAVSPQDVPSLAQTQAIATGAAGGIAPTLIALLSDLISTAVGKGAALIGFLQTGMSAFATTIQKKLQRSLDLLDFVDPANYAAALAGTFDLSPALGKAIDEALARGADCVRLPAGMLLLNTKITKSLTGFQGLAIEGKGMGLTQLICADPTGYGLEFNCAAQNWWIDVSPSNPMRIANLSICSTVLNLGTGLKINGGSLEGRPRAACVLDHLEIRAKDSINNQAFLTGLWLNDCGDMHAVGCRFFVGGTTNLTPTAVLISSTDATTDPTVFNFDHCEWYYGGKGIVAGDNPEGIYLTQCTMVKVDQGVAWTAAAESGLHVIGGHYNCLSYDFNLDGVYDFVISDALLFLSGASPQSAISVKNGSSFTITGNSISGTPIGIDVGTLPAGYRGGYIGGNQFSNGTTGINLSGAANNITVGPNGFTSVTNRVVGAGGAGSFIQKRSWAASLAPTLAGGAAFEAVNFAVPSNTFLAKPTVVVATAEGAAADYLCEYNSSTSTATNIQLKIVRRDGATITAGAARFNIVAYE